MPVIVTGAAGFFCLLDRGEAVVGVDGFNAYLADNGARRVVHQATQAGVRYSLETLLAHKLQPGGPLGDHPDLPLRRRGNMFVKVNRKGAPAGHATRQDDDHPPVLLSGFSHLANSLEWIS